MANNLEGRKVSEVCFAVENFFDSNIWPQTTKVTYRNGQQFFGFFNDFGDADDLRQENKYRFVPSNNSPEFNDDRSKNGKEDPRYSVIIDAKEVVDLRMMNALSKTEVFMPLFQEYIDK